VLVTALVVGLAALSAYRFVVFGERAHQPLLDPNNYAALMYLGQVVEFAATERLFDNPRTQRTSDYITGRFG